MSLSVSDQLLPGPALSLQPEVTAVVLGGGGGDALSQAAGVPAKALVPFGGQPLVSYVLRALHDCPAVGPVLYVGETTPALVPETEQVLAAGETLAESLAAGVHAALVLDPNRPVLVTTADLPWLRADALSDFLAAASGADLAYPVVAERTYKAQFPEQKRTFVRLKEGRFTGGNMMLLSPEMVPALLPFAQHAYQSRKNPLALARLFGADFMVRLALGQLSLDAIERRAERILGLSVRAVVTGHASIGADVDKPEHLLGCLPNQPEEHP